MIANAFGRQLLFTLAILGFGLCLLLILSGCAHEQVEAPASAYPPVTDATLGCKVLKEPTHFFCSVDGRPILNGFTVRVCQLHNPERWVLTNTEKHSMTFVGATCFLGVDDAF